MKLTLEEVQFLLDVLMDARQNAYEMGNDDDVAKVDEVTRIIRKLLEAQK